MIDPAPADPRDLHRRAKHVFQGALRLPEAEREEFVAEACGADRALRTEVLNLLAHDRPLDVADTPSRGTLERLVRRLQSGLEK